MVKREMSLTDKRYATAAQQTRAPERGERSSYGSTSVPRRAR
jgi:hypothetical protein